MPKFSIVVPFHNEQESVTALYDRLKAVMEATGDTFELVFVDDGSLDRTYKLLREIVTIDSRVVVVKLRRNFGQTSALAAGFAHAQGEFVIAMDGDLQHDPEDIPKFLEMLEQGYDLVSGWRKERVDNFVMRRIPSRIANWAMSKLSGVDIHDFGTTYKAYRREIIQQLPLYGELHRFIPALLEMRGFSIGEIPVNHRPRRSGKTKYNEVRTIKGLADIMLLWFWRTYAVRPIHLLGGVGVLFLLISAIFGLRTVYLFVIHQKLSSTLEPLLTVFSFIAGLLFLSLGILSDILIKIYYAIVPEPYYSVREIIREGSAEMGKEHSKALSERP